eukprot:scaffold172_cov341-Pavlova_lutheri.AAC.12
MLVLGSAGKLAEAGFLHAFRPTVSISDASNILPFLALFPLCFSLFLRTVNFCCWSTSIPLGTSFLRPPPLHVSKPSEAVIPPLMPLPDAISVAKVGAKGPGFPRKIWREGGSEVGSGGKRSVADTFEVGSGGFDPRPFPFVREIEGGVRSGVPVKHGNSWVVGRRILGGRNSTGWRSGREDSPPRNHGDGRGGMHRRRVPSSFLGCKGSAQQEADGQDPEGAMARTCIYPTHGRTRDGWVQSSLPGTQPLPSSTYTVGHGPVPRSHASHQRVWNKSNPPLVGSLPNCNWTGVGIERRGTFSRSGGTFPPDFSREGRGGDTRLAVKSAGSEHGGRRDGDRAAGGRDAKRCVHQGSDVPPADVHVLFRR